MKIEDVQAYLKELDAIEEANGWLPSPHAIEPYIDYIQALGATDGWTDELLDLEDRLCDHYQGAYEQ
jgi:hypothetical protein